jgi:hypothetical protein
VADLLHRDSRAEVWLGSCLEPLDVIQAMNGKRADLLCLDAPYSETTHKGHELGKLTTDRAGGFAESREGNPTPESRYAARKANQVDAGRREIPYQFWTPANVSAFVDIWGEHVAGWIVTITDDVLAPAWRNSLAATDRYVFPALPLVETGSRVRVNGDGPSNWTCWVIVARPRTREFASWGTLPGAYFQPAERDMNSHRGSTRVVGGKPLSAMLRIVGDYSRRGGLVVDPTCGGGTTLKAAIASGRQAIGMDVMREHAELTIRNIASTREQTSLFEVGT